LKFKYHILFVSLVFSLILWLSLNFSLTYERNYQIPIKINIDKPYAVANPIPLNLSLKLRAKGWNFISLYTSTNPVFVYNVEPSFGNASVVVNKQYIIDNLTSLENLNILDVKPDSLLIKIDKYTEKYVKLKPLVNIDCKPGYQTVGKYLLEPDSIKIGGSVSILNNLSYLSTKFLNYNKVYLNIDQIVQITDSLSNIIWKSQDETKLKINVELSAEKILKDVELILPDVPNDKEVMLLPPVVTINIRGGVNQLSVLDNSKIKAFLDYNTIFLDTTGSVTPKFIFPEGIILNHFSPEKIQYIIKKKY
jgi:hypothetical protein